MAQNVDLSDLKKLNQLETIKKEQFQFIAPFRCVVFGLVKSNLKKRINIDFHRGKKIKFENKFSTFFHSFLILFRQSGSGKSSFISSIIREKSRLLKPSPTKVIWIYNKYYKDYHEVLSQSIENIEFSPTFDYETIMEVLNWNRKKTIISLFWMIYYNYKTIWI